MNFKTPLSIVTGLGSAKDGTTHFWHQRLTALANIPLMLFLVWLVVTIGGADKAGMVAVLSNPIVGGLLVLTIVSMTWHMRLGMQVIIEDYVHGEAIKIVSLAANNLFAVLIAGLAIVSVLKLSFGG